MSIVVLIVGIACVAKIIGAGLGARMSGIEKNESLAIAFGMNARGSQEIVLGSVALSAKIIDEKIFVGLVIMTMLTILIAGPLMKLFLNKHVQKQTSVNDEALSMANTRLISGSAVGERAISLQH